MEKLKVFKHPPTQCPEHTLSTLI